MPRSKKKAEEEQQIEQPMEQPVEEIVDRTTEEMQPTDELIGTFCSRGYDFELSTTRKLMVDDTTLSLMLSGAFRPFQKYDRVVFKAQDRKHFALFLAFRAVMPGGVILVSPDLAGLRMFRDCPQEVEGEMVRVTKK
jgi:hypothetical protein